MGKIYMIVTDDELELPVAVADSVQELAAITKINARTLRGCLYSGNGRKLRLPGGKYGKVLKI